MQFEEQRDSLLSEGKEFFKMMRKMKQSKYPDAGTEAYLISKKWLMAYKNFISYRDVKKNQKPEFEIDHFEKNHPGEISNKEDLIVEDP